MNLVRNGARVLAAFLLLTVSSGGYAVVMTVSDATGAPGDTVSVDIDITLGASESLGSADFGLAYDSSVLTFLSGATALSLGSFGSFAVGDPAPLDQVDVSMAFDLGSELFGAGTFTLATIDYEIVNSAAAGDVALALVPKTGSPEILLTDDFLSTISYTHDSVDNGTVTIESAAPEPPVLMLLGVGLLMLGVKRLRPRHSA